MKKVSYYRLTAKNDGIIFGQWKCNIKLPENCELLSVSGANDCPHAQKNIPFSICTLENVSDYKKCSTFEFLVVKNMHNTSIDDDYIFLGCTSNSYITTFNNSATYYYNVFYRKV